jgi:hypothetical protein
LTDDGAGGLGLLSAAVVSTAKATKGRWLFVGWDDHDRPATAESLAGLGPAARRAYHVYRESGLWPRQVRWTSLEAVEYVLTGPAVDFADHGGQLAQDQLQYVVLDARGDRSEIALGELAVLEAIVSAREPWQRVGESSSAEIAKSAVLLYTLFLPNPGAPPGTGLALLFRPTIPQSGNEPAFRAFVRQSLGRLLVLDESQPAGSRKGYLDAAAELASLPPESGVGSLLVRLRELGFIDFEDSWLRGAYRRMGSVRAGFLRALRVFGAVEISDDVLHEIAHPRPDYDLDALAMGQLVALAEAMYWRAHEALSRS